MARRKPVPVPNVVDGGDTCRLSIVGNDHGGSTIRQRHPVRIAFTVHFVALFTTK